MTSAASVRRVRLHEWREVRDLRIEAVGDPDASIAFLTTTAEELARGDDFWQARTAGAALGESGAQFVAIEDEAWVGSATVLLREPGSRNHLGQEVVARRADVVGVYLSPAHRGRGILGELFDAVAEWSSAQGVDALMLDVHTENARARAAYGRIGFTPTGVTFTSVIGPELEMRRPLLATRGVRRHPDDLRASTGGNGADGGPGAPNPPPFAPSPPFRAAQQSPARVIA